MEKTKFNWKCIHCGKRNMDVIGYQFDIPKQYVAEWGCPRCGKITKLSLIFKIDFP